MLKECWFSRFGFPVKISLYYVFSLSFIFLFKINISSSLMLGLAWKCVSFPNKENL
jgi:hypothetical protein